MAFFEKIREKIDSILEKPILTNSLVLLAMSLFVVSLSFRYYLSEPSEFLLNILSEMHGMIFDILVIGILIFWLNEKGRIRQQIRTYRDEIDDFRLWKSEEAAFRNVGNIKRLNRHNISEINLVETYLSRTNLTDVVLTKSNLNSADVSNSILRGANLSSTRLNQTRFENSDMNNTCFKDSFASGADFRDAYLIKSDFRNSFLIKANFENAYLMESDFRGTHLSGAEFANANLYKADFRGASGLSIEQFSVAKSLYLAQFDPEFLEKVSSLYPELVG